jgi:Flavoprotein
MAETASGKTLNRHLRRDGYVHILLGVTGSVAAIKAPEIICSLIEAFGPKVSVKVMLTRGGGNFWDKAAAYDATYWSKMLEWTRQPSQTLHSPSVQVYSTLHS